jgi:hypothetical protein
MLAAVDGRDLSAWLLGRALRPASVKALRGQAVQGRHYYSEGTRQGKDS